MGFELYKAHSSRTEYFVIASGERERERGGKSFTGIRRLREKGFRARNWKMIQKITRKHLENANPKSYGLRRNYWVGSV
jgi:hypothetical protein